MSMRDDLLLHMRVDSVESGVAQTLEDPEGRSKSRAQVALADDLWLVIVLPL